MVIHQIIINLPLIGALDAVSEYLFNAHACITNHYVDAYYNIMIKECCGHSQDNLQDSAQRSDIDFFEEFDDLEDY